MTFKPEPKDEKELTPYKAEGPGVTSIQRQPQVSTCELGMCQDRDQQTLSLKEQIVNTSGLTVSVVTAHLCC